MPSMARQPGETRGRPRKDPDLDPAAVKLAQSLRERIAAEADPVGFLCRVVSGKPVGGRYVNGEWTDDGQPADTGTRIEIACKLAAKVVPDLKGIEVSGGEKPVELGGGSAFDAIVGRLGRIAESQRASSTTH